MEKMDNEYRVLLDRILETYNKEISENLMGYKVNYLKDTGTYEIMFFIKLDKGGSIKNSIEFPLDFGSIQVFLNTKQVDSDIPKISISSVENRCFLANILSNKFEDFIKFIEFVGFFNSEKDYCDQIADYIILKKGAIKGEKFGI
jgi:hypothetical protein